MGIRKKEAKGARFVGSKLMATLWQKMLRVHITTAIESWQYLWHKPFTHILAWVTQAVILGLPGLVIWLLIQIQPLTAQLDNQRYINAFLELDTTETQTQALVRSLSAWQNIEKVTWISAQQAKQEFSQATGLQDIFDSLSYNPLPATLLITPTSFDPISIKILTQKLKNNHSIQTVVVNNSWLDKANSLITVSQRITWILAVLMTVGIVLVVSNTTHMQIRSNKVEISVIQIIGGTDAYLLRPFLYRALWGGLLTGLLACFIILIFLAFITPALSALIHSFNLDLVITNLSFKAMVILILTSCILNLTSSALTAMYYLGRLRT